jgi:hypothetical protein
MNIEITREQREIMEHALGLNNGKGPTRNSFASASDCDGYSDIMALVEMGLMKGGQIVPDGYLQRFHVTDAGKAFLDFKEHDPR